MFVVSHFPDASLRAPHYCITRPGADNAVAKGFLLTEDAQALIDLAELARRLAAMPRTQGRRAASD
jgi:hypothetical protein